MFRPVKMIWVDLLVDRDSVNTVLDLLGNLQVIELQQYDRPEVPFEVSGNQSHIKFLAELEHELKQLADCLPAEDLSAVTRSRRDLSTDAVLPELQTRLRTWAAQAQPLARKLRETGTRMEELELLALGLPALGQEEIDVALLADDGHKGFPPFLVLADATDLEALDSRAPLIVRAYPLEWPAVGKAQQVLLVGVTDADAIEELERQFHARGMRFVRVPSGLHGSGAAALQQVQSMQQRQQKARQRLESELADLNRRTGIAGDLWLLRRHSWVNEALASSLVGERFVWLGGWVPAARYDELLATLDDSGVPFLIHQEYAAAYGEPPVQLSNPAWIRRFEIFVTSFGVPAADDVDPSPILAVMTPLMFGYMFGDVGHGAVLMVVGWLGRRRLPVLTLLIPGGLVGVLFGFLYGSVFCNEELLPALWLRPLEEPLWILGVPIVFGWLVVLVSMLLAGVQAHWQRHALRWWTMEAPLVLLYIALTLALIWLRIGIVVALFALLCLFCTAAVYGYHRRGWAGILPGLLSELLELLEKVFQLLVNTISFARLGAFALAHAGLSAAVIVIADMPASSIAAIIIFVLGNGVVIALEGLVVSIQTTRLVMFEFFRRFMVGEGRPFRPLSLPNKSKLVF